MSNTPNQEAFDKVFEDELTEICQIDEDVNALRRLIDDYRCARPEVRERFLGIVNKAQSAQAGTEAT